MVTRIATAGLLIVALVLLGCDSDAKETTWEGSFSAGFEVQAFSPCLSDQQWWTNGTDLHRRYYALGLAEYEEAYARLRGHLSGPGEYGHMGAYRREFEVTQVLEIRQKQEDDCR